MFEYAKVTDWQYDQGIVITKCRYKLPPIFFYIDGSWIEARPEDYLYDFAGNGVNCMLFITPASTGMNILGMPLHVDYYTVHDPSTGKVSWAPHKDSAKGRVLSGPPPTGERLLRSPGSQDSSKRLPSWATLIVVIIMAILSVAAWEKWFIPWVSDVSKRRQKVYSLAFFAFAMAFTYYAMFPILAAILTTDEK